MDQVSFQSSWPRLTTFPASVITQEGTTYALVTDERGQRQLAVQTASENHLDLGGYAGDKVNLMSK